MYNGTSNEIFKVHYTYSGAFNGYTDSNIFLDHIQDATDES